MNITFGCWIFELVSSISGGSTYLDDFPWRRLCVFIRSEASE